MPTYVACWACICSMGYAPGARDANATALLAIAYCLLPCALKALAATALQFLIIQPTAQPHTP